MCHNLAENKEPRGTGGSTEEKAGIPVCPLVEKAPENTGIFTRFRV